MTAPQQQLIYFGGSVISNVKIVAVNWGPNVSTAISGAIGAFYAAITDSAYFDWLSEYDTTGVRAADGALGTSQRIGRGSFVGSFTIEPTTTQTNLSDTDIERELAAQIAAGKLPAPETDAAGNVNTLYMFDFPPDPAVTITLWNAGSLATGCSEFGAYHSTVRIGSLSVPYGVHPDCGDPFTSATVAHSHEMIEAVTDTDVGLVDPDLTPGETRPSAWYSFIGGVDDGEAADLCETGASATVAGYNVATIWSNSQGACIATSPTIICDGSAPAIAGCRACTAADDGVACNGERAYCETDATNAKFGQCVICTASTQCPAAEPTCNKAADATDDTCVSTAACSGDGQCSGTTPICDTGSHVCRPCVAGDCSGATPACETLAGNVNFGRCVACTESNGTACVVPAHACDTFTNKCVACMFNSDCGASTPVCSFPGHTCVACATNADCAAGGGVCATGATDPNKGSCVECVTSTDCLSPATCSANDACSGGSALGADAGSSGDGGGDMDASADTDGGEGDDAGASSDSGTAADTGALADASEADSSAPDLDSSAPDSSVVDSGSPDSSARDSGGGRLDASSPGADAAPVNARDSGSTTEDSGTPVSTDAGAPADDSGSEGAEGGVGGAGTSSGGCGCTTAPDRSSPNGVITAFLIALATVARRRRLGLRDAGVPGGGASRTLS